MTTQRFAVVLAGGLGTRLHSVTGDRIPKALVPVLNKPFLFYKLGQLEHLGVTEVLLLTGHHGGQIDLFLKEFDFPNLRISCRADGEEPLGTAGALKTAESDLPEKFWVTYGDTLVSADLTAAEALMELKGSSGLMVVLKNDNKWQPSNVSVRDNFVVSYEKGSSNTSLTHIDFGLILLDKRSLVHIPGEQRCDLSVLFQALANSHELAAWSTPEMFHDVGTPSALAETERWLSRMGY